MEKTLLVIDEKGRCFFLREWRKPRPLIALFFKFNVTADHV